MKIPHLHFTLAVATLLIVPSQSAAQWTQTNGPYGGTISCLAVSGTTLYAGTYLGRIYRSINFGMNWTLANDGLRSYDGNYIKALAASGNNLIATTGDGIFRSNNYGTSWSNAGFPDEYHISSVAMSNGTIYLGKTTGNYHSTDNGASWIPDSSSAEIHDSSKVRSMPATPVDAGVFAEYKGGILASGNGTFFSPDNGASWITLGEPMCCQTSLATLGNCVFVAGLDIGIRKLSSPLDSAYWYQSATGLNWPDVRALVTNENFVFAGTYGGGVFRSEDRGDTWNAVNMGLDDPYVLALAMIGGYLFAGTNGGVFRSSDYGLSWTSVNLGITFPVEALSWFRNSLVAGTKGGGVFLSSNNGMSWQAINDGLVNYAAGSTIGRSVSSLAWSWSSTRGSILYAGTSGWGVARSTNNGQTWSNSTTYNVGSLYGKAVYCLGVGSVDPDRILAGTSNGVYYSGDNGLSWSVTALTGTQVNGISANGSGVYAGTLSGFYTANFSPPSFWPWVSTWSDPVTALWSSVGEIFQATSNGVYVSLDGGGGWEQRNSGLPANSTLNAFAESGRNLFAVVWGAGFFVSTNRGMNWVTANTGLAGLDTRSLTVNDSNLFVGTYWNGVWQRPLSEIVTAVNEQVTTPRTFSLFQNYPNPANPATMISYQLPASARVVLKVFDVLGREVRTLVDEHQSVGNHFMRFDASDLSSGVYFYWLQADAHSDIKKMLVLK